MQRRLAVGIAGYHDAPDSRGMVEIGYGVRPLHQRRGYGGVALECLLRRAASEPEVRTVRAVIEQDNTVSYRLAMRFGFVEVGQRWNADGALEIIYERPAEPT